MINCDAFALISVLWRSSFLSPPEHMPIQRAPDSGSQSNFRHQVAFVDYLTMANPVGGTELHRHSDLRQQSPISALALVQAALDVLLAVCIPDKKSKAS